MIRLLLYKLRSSRGRRTTPDTGEQTIIVSVKKNALQIHHLKASRKFRLRAAVKFFWPVLYICVIFREEPADRYKESKYKQREESPEARGAKHHDKFRDHQDNRSDKR